MKLDQVKEPVTKVGLITTLQDTINFSPTASINGYYQQVLEALNADDLHILRSFSQIKLWPCEDLQSYLESLED